MMSGPEASLIAPVGPEMRVLGELAQVRRRTAGQLARSGDALRRLWAPSDGVRIVINTSVPHRGLTRRWGDWAYACELARELQVLGHHVAIRTRDEWSHRSSSRYHVSLHLKGRGQAPRAAAERHILWVISHPDELDLAACDAADLVLVASAPFAAELRARTAARVEVLHQATNPRRFDPSAYDSSVIADLLYVGNARRNSEMRLALAYALASGFRPVVYGAGWDGRLPDATVARGPIHNRHLPRLYASAAVVLNDHWPDMRRLGFISNRIFDALACGAAVLSDDVAGLEEAIPGTVRTYTDQASFAAHASELLASPDLRGELGARGRQLVLERHTFQARAEVLSRYIRELGVG